MPSARMARAHMPQESLTICLTVANTSAGTPLPAHVLFFTCMFEHVRHQTC